MKKRTLNDLLSKSIDACPVFPPRCRGIDVLSVVKIDSEREIGDMLIPTGVNLRDYASGELARMLEDDGIDETEPSEDEKKFAVSASTGATLGIDVPPVQALGTGSDSVSIEISVIGEERAIVDNGLAKLVRDLLYEKFFFLIATTSLAVHVRKRFCIGVVMEVVKGKLKLADEVDTIADVSVGVRGAGDDPIASARASLIKALGSSLDSSGVIGVNLLCFAVKCEKNEMHVSKAFNVGRPLDRPLRATRTWMRGGLGWTNFIRLIYYKRHIFMGAFVQSANDPRFKENPEWKKEFENVLQSDGRCKLSADEDTNMQESSTVDMIETFGGLEFSDLWDDQVVANESAESQYCLIADGLAHVNDLSIDERLAWLVRLKLPDNFKEAES